jgi:Holliday junction resolvase
MPNANYESGRRFEYKIAKELRAEGHVVMRTAGSHGPFDLICITPEGDVGLIQCKRVKTDAEAKRLTTKFRENPPLPSSGNYEQEIVVYVAENRTRRAAFV